MSDLQPPAGARPWPDHCEEPRPQGSPPALDVPDGSYFSRHASGRLRLVATVRRGQLEGWLRLEDGQPAGFFKLEGRAWLAQRFVQGTLEDFSRDDDTSSPYPADVSFEEWARERVALLAEEPRLPPWLQEAQRVYRAMCAQDRPPPHQEKPLSGPPEPVEDLEQRLPQFQDLAWSSPSQCYERLVHFFKWEPTLARDFTNFATAGCAAAVHSPAAEVFLYPSWHGACLEQPLEEIPLFVRVRDLALCDSLEAPLELDFLPRPAGPGYRLLVAAAHWALEGEGGPTLAARLGHFMLSTF